MQAIIGFLVFICILVIAHFIYKVVEHLRQPGERYLLALVFTIGVMITLVSYLNETH